MKIIHVGKIITTRIIFSMIHNKITENHFSAVFTVIKETMCKIKE